MGEDAHELNRLSSRVHLLESALERLLERIKWTAARKRNGEVTHLLCWDNCENMELKGHSTLNNVYDEYYSYYSEEEQGW